MQFKKYFSLLIPYTKYYTWTRERLLMVIHRYLDPKNDLAFKKIFGEEKHKRIPISFLNAALNLEGDAKIVDLEFINTVQSPEIEARKESIVDVLVRDQKGTRYIIEMQVARIEGFEKRAQFYAAKAYCSHFNKGGQYSDLAKVVFLAITDYVVFPDKPGYKCNHEILDTETYEQDL
ncbi:MAG TPA: Rpn family recombination-promoting nuclease/putative transposase, partial [Chlamydiales bacterium]|nr:Rpn family recombination-promoting nuclease/putative transposase [Chlamydiales bacterium]